MDRWFRFVNNGDFHLGTLGADTVYLACDQGMALPDDIIDMVRDVECNKKCKFCYNVWFDARTKEMERTHGR